MFSPFAISDSMISTPKHVARRRLKMVEQVSTLPPARDTFRLYAFAT